MVSFQNLVQNILPVAIFALMAWVGNSIKENGDHVIAMQTELVFVREALAEIKNERGLIRDALANQQNLNKSTQDAMERLRSLETKVHTLELRVHRLSNGKDLD